MSHGRCRGVAWCLLFIVQARFPRWTSSPMMHHGYWTPLIQWLMQRRDRGALWESPIREPRRWWMDAGGTQITTPMQWHFQIEILWGLDKIVRYSIFHWKVETFRREGKEWVQVLEGMYSELCSYWLSHWRKCKGVSDMGEKVPSQAFWCCCLCG